MIARLFFGVLCLALFWLSFTNMRHVIDGAPAFDVDARVPGVFGDWRVQHGPSHYNRAKYLERLSEGFLRADVVVSETTGGSEELVSDEMVIARADRAEDLLRESLALSPANAHAWSSLSWAQALQGRVEAARASMANSWKLAPYNIELAQTRLHFIEFLAEDVLANGSQDLLPSERLGVQRDFTTVYEMDPKTAGLILEASTLISDVNSESN